MNRSVQLSIFLLLFLAACSQKQPDLTISETPSPSATPVSPTPSVDLPPSPDVSTTNTPASIPAPINSAFPTSSPDYGIPSPVAITKLSPPTPKHIPTVTLSTPLPKTDRKKAIEVIQELSITSDGIGIAKVGMTLGELRNALGSKATFEVKDSFAENYSAIAVRQNGKIQYYIPYPQDSTVDDDYRIRLLVTDNPDYKTAQGVSPGTPIKIAAKLYGNATLIFNREGESQEIIKFSNQPKELIFRSQQTTDKDLAGIYPESNDDQIETDKYTDQATIRSIVVSCKEDVCGAEH